MNDNKKDYRNVKIDEAAFEKALALTQAEANIPPEAYDCFVEGSRAFTQFYEGSKLVSGSE